jgi:hypothetical protein
VSRNLESAIKGLSGETVHVTMAPSSPFGDVIEGIGRLNELNTRNRLSVARAEEKMSELARQEGIDRFVAAKLRQRVIEREVEHRLMLVDMHDVDEFDDGTVLRFTKQYTADGPAYTYVVLKAGGSWYRTGRDCPTVKQKMGWDDLVLWLVSGVDPVEPERLEFMVPLDDEDEDDEYEPDSPMARLSQNVTRLEGVYRDLADKIRAIAEEHRLVVPGLRESEDASENEKARRTDRILDEFQQLADSTVDERSARLSPEKDVQAVEPEPRRPAQVEVDRWPQPPTRTEVTTPRFELRPLDEEGRPEDTQPMLPMTMATSAYPPVEESADEDRYEYDSAERDERSS